MTEESFKCTDMREENFNQNEVSLINYIKLDKRFCPEGQVRQVAGMSHEERIELLESICNAVEYIIFATRQHNFKHRYLLSIWILTMLSIIMCPMLRTTPLA